MKERIKELASRIYIDQGCQPSMELRCEVIAATINEALEMAAKECHLRAVDMRIHSLAQKGALDCAEAIRKLKV